MDRLGIGQIAASMLSGMGLGGGSAELVTRIHATKKGSGRSKGMKIKRHAERNESTPGNDRSAGLGKDEVKYLLGYSYARIRSNLSGSCSFRY